MRFVIISDLHADAHLAGVPRLIEVCQALSLAAQEHSRIEDERKAEAVAVGGEVRDRPWFVFLGDVLDCARLDERTPDLVASLRRVRQAEDRSIVIAGNHDASSIGERSSASLVWPHCHDAPAILPWGDADLLSLVLPYSFAHDQAHYDAIAEAFLAELGTGRGIVFSHLEFDAATDGSEREMPRGGRLAIPACLLRDDRVIAIVNGHYHVPQRHGKIIVPGAPVRLRWDEGDPHERGYLVLEVKGRRTDVDRPRKSALEEVAIDLHDGPMADPGGGSTRPAGTGDQGTGAGSGKEGDARCEEHGDARQAKPKGRRRLIPA